MIQVFLFHIDLTITVAMVTENGRQNRLKSKKCHFDKDSYPHDCRADNAPYRHNRRADKNPYRHDRNMRFSSKLNYALFSILMVSCCFFQLCFIAVGSKHLRFNDCITRIKAFETKM